MQDGGATLDISNDVAAPVTCSSNNNNSSNNNFEYVDFDNGAAAAATTANNSVYVPPQNYDAYSAVVAPQDQHYQYYPDYASASAGCYYEAQQPIEFESAADGIGNDYYSHYYNNGQEYYWNSQNGQQDEAG